MTFKKAVLGLALVGSLSGCSSKQPVHDYKPSYVGSSVSETDQKYDGGVFRLKTYLSSYDTNFEDFKLGGMNISSRIFYNVAKLNQVLRGFSPDFLSGLSPNDKSYADTTCSLICDYLKNYQVSWDLLVKGGKKVEEIEKNFLKISDSYEERNIPVPEQATDAYKEAFELLKELEAKTSDYVEGIDLGIESLECIVSRSRIKKQLSSD